MMPLCKWRASIHCCHHSVVIPQYSAWFFGPSWGGRSPRESDGTQISCEAPNNRKCESVSISSLMFFVEKVSGWCAMKWIGLHTFDSPVPSIKIAQCPVDPISSKSTIILWRLGAFQLKRFLPWFLGWDHTSTAHQSLALSWSPVQSRWWRQIADQMVRHGGMHRKVARSCQ